MYGLQWLVVTIPVILILGRILGEIHFEDVPSQILYMQKIFLLSGIFLIIQVLWGHRLPLVIGPSSVLLVGIVSSLIFSLSTIYTSIAIGGVLLFILSQTGLISKINYLFTPRIIVVILLLIGFTLTPVILNLLFGNSEGYENFHFWFSILFTVLMLLMNKVFVGIWKSTVILIGLAVGSVVYILLGKPIESFQAIGLLEVISSDKTAFFTYPLEFDYGVVIAFLFCYLALIINELGSIQAIGRVLEVNDIDKRTKRGVAVTGIANIFSGMCGVIGMVNFSFSPGVVSATRCASRFVLIPTGIGLILLSVFPEFVSVLNHIPPVVVGAIMFYLMVVQLASGFDMMQRQKAVFDFNSAIVIGFPIIMSVLIAYLPQPIVDAMPQIVRPILTNGFVMGVITVIVCEHFLFKEKKHEIQKNA